MELPQCVDELEDDVFQPEDGEPGTTPGSLLSSDLFAQSPMDCSLSRLQLFPLTHCCGPGLRPASQEDKATQTLSPASPSQGVMLPCGVTEEPQRLFYGNAGYRLPLPNSFPAGSPFAEQRREGQWQQRVEVQIARKLQCIADQFHHLHMQQSTTQLWLMEMRRIEPKDLPQRQKERRRGKQGLQHCRWGLGLEPRSSNMHQQNRNPVWWPFLLFLHNLALNEGKDRTADKSQPQRNPDSLDSLETTYLLLLAPHPFFTPNGATRNSPHSGFAGITDMRVSVQLGSHFLSTAFSS
ncbi:bcl-2-modifying factor isoform X2 [Erinaceus europaeus]|nr:bcl-2-modifying factor isoform X2 [Erinaceus europaeus]XP_060031121.1 bcl-2-modifying factor isoform X2 [Erinaceus europaeus]XP_060031122.1 bcl-2-modifying factor isoform X2 [Erinaceus europaeus]XP_060031123.1 bcl-2-modifying factor isoform X2 [Erinaceus europaeus]XP_060031130.1 bcl-2-modifying factor isoform X2 [Erinaceus europaeus]